MARSYFFADLPPTEQQRACGRFLGARQGDGYRYELDIDGKVLCRFKPPAPTLVNPLGEASIPAILVKDCTSAPGLAVLFGATRPLSTTWATELYRRARRG